MRCSGHRCVLDSSLVQGWHAAALIPAGSVSALCQASTPGPFTTSLGKTSISFPHLHATPPQFGDILEKSDLCAPFENVAPLFLPNRPDCPPWWLRAGWHRLTGVHKRLRLRFAPALSSQTERAALAFAGDHTALYHPEILTNESGFMARISMVW